MNIPNMLTIFRLLLIPVFLVVFFSNVPNYLLYSIVVFLVAGATDVLDGYIARKYDMVTKWGIVLDPLADKLMLLTVLFSLSYKGIIPYSIFIIVCSKEVLMIISGIFLYKKDTVIPSNFFGKASTVLFYVSILTVAFNKNIGKILLDIAVISAIIALINYAIIYLKNQKNNN
ncbi:CDP-diacylglycerol--glycerol-3-phosphate 3-phosphatidyltransferase [Clostridium sp. MSJ-4]|uniref:CDP-diacylglycerol--glycerol-3-phosphate 3-phosphatidyltransferase n=1 Tax=Clostridium simiarum TaxID=2841506 RepID=A0ABS6F1H8_9CLOT|nr:MULTISPECIES: CDP-diacylglycerol--glycerol-3-phosphate 3-phosphatidyltransferase [Clostridium]MBU5592348.1 CDP-diacylglycerol--glycerol-3-phosphate 3-phosphatidyltransferase [Clostridium simiarum]